MGRRRKNEVNELLQEIKDSIESTPRLSIFKQVQNHVFISKKTF